MEFQPENELEQAVVDAKQGDYSLEELMRFIVGSFLYIPSMAEVLASATGEIDKDWSGFEPLLFEENNQSLVVAFSSLSRSEKARDQAEYGMKSTGRDFILRLPPGYGFILNPGYVGQFIVPPSGIAELKEDVRGMARLVAFKPENELEQAIMDVRQDAMDMTDMIKLLADSDIYVLSRGLIDDDWSGFDPVLFDFGSDTFIAVFSSPVRPDLHQDKAKYVLQINAREFIKRVSPTFGLVINPGYSSQFTISPSGLAKFRKELVRP
jgi:hypothetical protein